MSQTLPQFDEALAYIPDEHARHVAARVRPYFGCLATGGMLSGRQLEELRQLVDATLEHLSRARTRPAGDASTRNHLPT